MAYIDVGVGLFQFLGIWALIKWVRTGARRALLVAAIFTGLAMGAKHTTIILAVSIAVVVVGRGVYKKEGVAAILQGLVLYSAVALAIALPWYLRALWEAGNPVWPVANSIFNGLAYKGSYSVSTGAVAAIPVNFVDRAKDLLYWSVASLWEWAWNENLGWQRAMGIYYVALLPGVIAYWKSVRVRWLAFACLAYYLLAVLYIDCNPRYNMALFALLSTLV